MKAEHEKMLAGEPFSDRPAAACPVIGGFLRAYNDRIDDERRQDLYRYAAMVVGSRGSAEVERAREQRCLEWAEERKRERSRPLRLTGEAVNSARKALSSRRARSASSLDIRAGMVGSGWLIR